MPKSEIHCPQIKKSKSTARRKLWLRLIAAGVLLLAAWLVTTWLAFRPLVHWPDRRPIGMLFLASHFHSSPSNPRGWFNDPKLDVVGTNSAENFRRALQDYTDRSLEILKRTGAQGVIVWDLEGEQLPHKISYIGDPRELGRLAPEMDAVADEFFQRLRDAGLRVGVTIRPQQFVLDEEQPRQAQVLNLEKVLAEKIDYARKRWGATLFYLDSNYGWLRPDEAWQFRHLAKQFPDVLLIPEHHTPLYGSFSAPLASLAKGDDPTAVEKWLRWFTPNAFQAVNISDRTDEWEKIATAQSNGDILLFRAWFAGPEVNLLESLDQEKANAPLAH